MAAGHVDLNNTPPVVSNSADHSDVSSSTLERGLRAALQMRPAQVRLHELETRLLQAQVAQLTLHIESPPIVLCDRWIVEERIGGGAMGVVFRVFDTRLRCRHALKVLIDRDDDAEAGRQRQRREAQAMAALRHDNIMQVIDHREDDPESGLTFVVMEFIDGTTLGGWLKELPRKPHRIVHKLLGVVRGLMAMHDKNLIHRDIKPDNLLVRRDDGPAIVGDLGLVRRMPEAEAPSAAPEVNASPASPLELQITDAGARVGTLAYMAPEQHGGELADQRSDQFSLFVVLFEAVCGERPFLGSDTPALTAAIRRGPCCRKLPWWLRRAVRRGLQHEPGARHQSMGVALKCLQRALWLRQWLFVSILAAATLGGLVWYWSQIDDPCDRVGEPLFAVWNDDSRVIVRDAFLASGLASAAQTWDRFAGGIDVFATDWSTHRRQTCAALQTASNSPPEHWRRVSARQACEQASLVLLRAFIDRYNRATAADVANSDVALDRLNERLRRCDNPELAGITGAVDRADDPTHARRNVAVQKTLAEAATLELAGEYPAAEALGGAALAAAEELNEPALAAESSLQAGRAAMLLRHRERATAWFKRAEQWAVRSGHREAFADARIERTKVAVLDFEDVALARELIALVEDSVAGLTGEQTRRQADAREVQAMLDRQLQHRSRAIAGYRETLALRSGAGDGAAQQVFRAQQNLANILSQPGATEEERREAGALYAAAVAACMQRWGNDHPRTAEARLALALYLTEENDLDGARAQLEQSMPVARDRFGTASWQVAKHELLSANLALIGGDLAKARTATDRALAFYDAQRGVSHHHSDHISALELRAELAMQAGDFAAALATYDDLLALLQTRPEERTTHAEILGYSAEALLGLGQADLALSRYRESMRVLDIGPDSRDQVHALLAVGLAETYARLGHREHALAVAQTARAIYDALTLTDDALARRIDAVSATR